MQITDLNRLLENCRSKYYATLSDLLMKTRITFWFSYSYSQIKHLISMSNRLINQLYKCFSLIIARQSSFHVYNYIQIRSSNKNVFVRFMGAVITS